jgi:phospholipase C
MPRVAAAIAAISIVSACSAGSDDTAFAGAAMPATAMIRAHRDVEYPQIQHVIIIIQENRSVDNLFQGFPNANVQSYGHDENGNYIPLQPVPLNIKWDIKHSAATFLKSCDGSGEYRSQNCKMDGFDLEGWTCDRKTSQPCPNANPPYSYVPASQTGPYVQLGEQYVLADEMFGSNYDSSSFVSHQYIIAAQAQSAINYPDDGWGCEGPLGDAVPTVTALRKKGPTESPCFNYTTLGDELDAASLPWRFYTNPIGKSGGTWSGYQAVSHIYFGQDWKTDVVTPATKFYSDVYNGNLPAVSWITPVCKDSDHAGCGGDGGPSWVASLVNAVGESKYWDSSVIFVFWDDYGGWYDHVAPKVLDNDGLGFRVPLLIVSPWAKNGYVSHTQYEHGSILKFIEQQWGLSSMSQSDARANNPAPECFDFTTTGKARPFKRIRAPYDMEYFLRQPPDLRPPDTD